MDTAKPTLRPQLQDERGATILQFALVFPLLVLIFAGIIDMSLLFSFESLLDEAAHRSVQRAVVISNLDVNPNGSSTTNFEYLRLIMARQKSNRSGVEFLRGTKSVDINFAEPNLNAQARVLPLSFTQSGIAGEDATITDGVMVLNPGECLQPLPNGQIICNRETLGMTPTDPPPATEPRFLMRRHPIMAVAMGTYNGYLPFFWNKTVVVKSYAYRQAIPPGPFAAWEDPELLAEGPPLPFGAPEEIETLGAPEMPQDEPITVCTVNWNLCIMRSMTDGVPRKPVNQLGPDGISCDCERY